MRKIVVRLSVFVLIFAVTASAQKRNISEKDLFDFTWVADPQISPDGGTVAFVRVTVNAKKDGYDTAIWSVSTSGTEEPHRLTSGMRDSTPRWSPDGKYLAFVRVPEGPGPLSGPQLFMLSMSGGDAFQFTSLPRGAGGPVWSPDGKWIVFGNSQNAAEVARAGKPATPPADGRESDVRVITRATYRSNGGGYNDNTHPNHIWVVAAPHTAEDKPTPKQLTSGDFSEGGFIWTRDSSRLYFTSRHVVEQEYELGSTELYSIPVSGGAPELFTTIDMGAGGFTLSPDGKQLAFVASPNMPVQSYTQPDLWVMDAIKDAKPRNLTTGFDFDVASGVGGDNAPPRGGGGGGLTWSPDGKSIITVYGKEGKANIGMFDAATGKETDVTTGDQSVSSFKPTPDGSKMVYSVSTPTRVGDLYVMDRSRQVKQITHSNDALFSKLNITEPEMIWYKSFDGKNIQAWVQKPPDFDPSKKYPLILNIHGGPHSAYGYVFDHEFQWMAAKGYVVLYPNPRGSTTYGQDFGNIIQYNYPGDDYKDLMAGVDEMLKRGYIDDKKLGVTGGSGGGLLTNWVVTQTQRFQAAVAQRDISDWANFWYTADFTLFQETWFKKPPFEDPEDYKARSPITYIKNVTTPMMFILGEADYRTPPTAGGEDMFRALKYRKIPTVMVRFPNESHELSRSGQPWHRIERLQHIVGWFDKWLMGMPKPEYEVGPTK
ncbi:MAG: prolyl oligopeptidase family serine peptidase [Pyrinomonadaceae bacterium]